jgi:hypothetical protein
MEKFKIGGACGTHRKEKKSIQGFGVTVQKSNPLVNLSVEWMMRLK